jgi:hypothetical protein
VYRQGAEGKGADENGDVRRVVLKEGRRREDGEADEVDKYDGDGDEKSDDNKVAG